LLQAYRIWQRRNQFWFEGRVGIAQADFAQAVIAGLQDVVIALLQ